MLTDLSRPESQYDPHHWAATLLAHAYIGVVLYQLTGSFVAVVVAYVAFELWQGGAFWDCVLDTVGVASGVYAVAHHSLAASVALLAVAAVGWYKRS